MTASYTANCKHPSTYLLA